MTENHDYDLPRKGASDWHVPINENFRRIDADVEVRDAEGRLDEYSPKDGAKFLATDTGAVYVGDGDSWNSLGRIGGPARSPTGPTRYVAPTDDFEAELSKASAGETVVAAPGTHTGLKNVEVPAGVHLHLPRGTVLEAATDMEDQDQVLLVRGSDVALTGRGTIDGLRSEQENLPENGTVPYQEHLIWVRGGPGDRNISNVYVGGQLTLRNPPAGDCLEILYCKDSTFEGLVCDNAYRNGITTVSETENVVLRNITVKNTGGTEPETGIDIEPENDSAVSLYLEGIRCHDNAQYGVEISTTSLESGRFTSEFSVRINGIDCQHNGYDGVSCVTLRDYDGPGVFVRNGYFANNGWAGMSLGDHLHVSNSVFYDNGRATDWTTQGAGVWHYSAPSWQPVATDCIVENCYFHPGSNQTAPAGLELDGGQFTFRNWYVETGHRATDGIHLVADAESGPFVNGANIGRSDGRSEVYSFGPGVDESRVETDPVRHLKEYGDDAEAANRELYFDKTDGSLEYKDGDGRIHELG